MLILGSGGLAREVQSYCCGNAILVPLQDDDKWIDTERSAVCAIGDPLRRQAVVAIYGNARIWRTIWATSSMQGTNDVGRGCYIAPGAIVSVDVIMGDHVIINYNATIGHDCTISDFCTISPGANISGNVALGRGVLVGSGAVILPGRNICGGSVIGAGAVVTKDVAPHTTVAGNPARVIG